MMVPPLPPEPTPAAKDTVAALLKMIADPAAAKEQHDALEAHSKALREHHDAIVQEQEKLDALSKELAANRDKLTKEQNALQPTRNDLNARHAALVKREKEVADSADAINKQRVQLEQDHATMVNWGNSEQAKYAAKNSELQRARAELHDKMQALNDKTVEADKIKADYESRIASLKRLVA